MHQLKKFPSGNENSRNPIGSCRSVAHQSLSTMSMTASCVTKKARAHDGIAEEKATQIVSVVTEGDEYRINKPKQC
jgi:hypothetical protein